MMIVLPALLISLIYYLCQVDAYAYFPFESCGTYSGNCSLSSGDSAVGTYTGQNLWIRDGYVDMGTTHSGYGCPFVNVSTCTNGFSYHGWTKFIEYPYNCSMKTFGVIVSTPMLNIHLLDNGHLAAYAWLPNTTEYYVESMVPVLLNAWMPVIVELRYFSTNSSYLLTMIAQDQLLAQTNVGRRRTYTPPSNHLLFGGTGVKNASYSASVRFDRTYIENPPQPLSTYYDRLVDQTSRQYYCTINKGALTRPLTCYWVETGAMTWTNAYANCYKQARSYGFSYGRLAWFPSWNTSVWNTVMKTIAAAGNGSVSGYNAWIGGGHNLQWLDGNMNPVGVNVVVPPGVTSNSSNSGATTCLQVNTKTNPWQWSETACTVSQKYICEMSYDCLMNNPCKNMGSCQPTNDGDNICKCWSSTSGRFCETGTADVNVIPPSPSCPSLIPNTTVSTIVSTDSTTAPTESTITSTVSTITSTESTTSSTTIAPTESTITSTVSTITSTESTTASTTIAPTESTIASTVSTTASIVSSSSDVAVGNCTNCTSKFIDLLKQVKLTVLQLKMNLVNLSIDTEDIEDWSCQQTNKFNRKVLALLKKTKQTNCSSIWEPYLKFKLHHKMVRWFLTLSRNNNYQLSPAVNTVLKKLNDTIELMTKAGCFSDSVMSHPKRFHVEPVLKFCDNDKHDGSSDEQDTNENASADKDD